jgi:hypothetical protein
MKPITVVLFCLVYLSLTAFAQNKKQIASLHYKAQLEFENLNFHAALPLFLKLDSINPNNPEYQYGVGVSSLLLNDEKTALVYLEKCKVKPDNHGHALNYYLARAYHLNYHFDSALVYYEAYRVFFTAKSKHHLELQADLEKNMQECRNGLELMKTPLKIKMTNLGNTINSSYPDYAPVISADETELIFTSNRPDSKGGKRDYAIDGHYYEDIYISYKTDSGWTAAKPISDSINTNDHDASVSLSPDGRKLLIYRYSDDNLVGYGSGDLYMSTDLGTTWSAPEKLGPAINNGRSWEPSASISEDGRMVFFSSDKQGGIGGTDLYYSIMDFNGQWGPAILLDSMINTERDEDSPFIHPDGHTLYFSSKGHNSMGGFDLFYSTWNDSSKAWSKALNMGYPLSSTHDDLHFSVSADGKRFYFAGIRPEGLGERDIYMAEVENITARQVALLKGFVLDSASLGIGAAISVTQILNYNGEEKLIGVFQAHPQTGHFTVVLPEGNNYRITIKKEGYEPTTEFVNISEERIYKEIEKQFVLLKEDE